MSKHVTTWRAPTVSSADNHHILGETLAEAGKECESRKEQATGRVAL